MRQETWESFWGELLLLKCHAGNPARWSARRERAARLFDLLNLQSGVGVLDLGCGDGLLDICLAELGACVTAVDRIASVIEAARNERGGEAVDFRVGDLRGLTFETGSFDVVLALELIGLMSTADDRGLLGRALEWLSPGGHIIVECPAQPYAAEGQWHQQLEDGVVRGRWTYCSVTRMLRMVPTLEAESGEMIALYDPYDPARAESGVVRYIYHPDELADMLVSTGYLANIVNEGFRAGMPLIIGRRP